MTGFLLGFAVLLPCLWVYSRLADLAALHDIKLKKRALLRRSLTHTGSFAELLHLQKNTLALAFSHLRRIALPAMVSLLPVLLFLWLVPEYATVEFALGALVAYGIAKWRWKI